MPLPTLARSRRAGRSWPRSPASAAQAVSRALARLVEIGALIRTGHGHYALNPRAGSLASREQAAQKPGPRLVEPA